MSEPSSAATMTISQAAKHCGLPAKTIRYYEDVGLITPANRSMSGYRLYSDQDVNGLKFIQRARSLGFSISDIADLLAMWQNPGRASADVRAMAERHLTTLTEKMAELEAMRQTLSSLIVHCHGDDRSDCAILDGLAGSNPAPTICPHCSPSENARKPAS